MSTLNLQDWNNILRKMLVFAVAFVLTACGKPSLEGIYENAPDTFVGHTSFNFKPEGIVTIHEFGKSIPDTNTQYKIDKGMVYIQNYAVPLKIFDDGSLDGYTFGVFKKK